MLLFLRIYYASKIHETKPNEIVAQASKEQKIKMCLATSLLCNFYKFLRII